MKAKDPSLIHSSMLMSAAFILGCTQAKPDHVATIPSTNPEIVFTADYFRGSGAVGNDGYRFYAALQGSQKSKRELVLGGQYVAVQRVIWSTPDEATLCITGSTIIFHNHVTVSSDSSYKQLHFLLSESC